MSVDRLDETLASAPLAKAKAGTRAAAKSAARIAATHEKGRGGISGNWICVDMPSVREALNGFAPMSPINRQLH
jgi:hypothetical protein